MDNNIQELLYRFKICVTLDDYKEALNCFDKIINEIEEYNLEEIEIINRLSKIIYKESTKILNTLINIEQNSEEEDKNIINFYMNYIHDDCLSIIRRLLFDIQLMENKIKNEIAIALINKIKGKLHSFFFKYDDNDKSGNLEKALFSYKKAIKIIILNNEKKNNDNDIDEETNESIIKFKILFSYCKFCKNCLKDYYRCILFCSNVIKDIKKELENNEVDGENIDDEYEENLQILLGKFNNFYEDNVETYNRVIKVYFPEIKKYA